jgi:hypothetical protein
MLNQAIVLSLLVRIMMQVSSIDFTTWPELVTPMSSMHRVREGLSLLKSNQSPYTGDMFHQPPLTILTFKPFFSNEGSRPIFYGLPLHILFFLGDVLVASMLRSIFAKKYQSDEVDNNMAIEKALQATKVAASVAATDNDARACKAAASGDGLGISSCFEDTSENASASPKSQVDLSPPLHVLEPVRNKYYVPSFIRDRSNLSNFIFAAYMLHPYAIGSSVAWDLSSLVRVSTVASMYYASTSHSFLSSFYLAVSTYFEFHPIILAVALAAIETKYKDGDNDSDNTRREKKVKTLNTKSSYTSTLLKYFSYIALCSLFLQILSYLALSFTMIEGEDDDNMNAMAMYKQSIKSSYIWHLTSSDHTPNVGLFWYLFSLLFQRFRPYFTFAFNIQIFIFVAPLVIRIRGRPYILYTVLTFLIGLLRPHPTLGDVSLPMILMLMHPFVVARMRCKAVLLITSIVCVALLRTTHWLWLYPGTACANHYYFVQMIYCLSLLILLSEFLNASLLRDREIEKLDKKNLPNHVDDDTQKKNLPNDGIEMDAKDKVTIDDRNPKN